MSALMNTSGTEADLEAIIARTALKYDLLPYTSNPFPQTQPARLGAHAKLFGFEPKPLESARVLELGSAAGGNIIPIAARYPNAEFVGVDLSRTQVAAGRARIAHLGLTNIEIHCKSFTELSAEDGKFDYIICHGVYSWVPAQVRDAILRICREHLSDCGVAMVSYNVLPGWRLLQALRDSFLLSIPDGNDSRNRAAQARNLLQFMKTYSPETGAYKQIINGWADRLIKMPDDYIAHEFLEEINEPCTFRTFIKAAESHRLSFLGEADLPSMILDNLPAETAAKIREASSNNLIASEQLLDILNGRTFRQTILVKAEMDSGINRNLTPEQVAGLHALTGSDLIVKRFEKGGEVVDGAGRKLASEHSVVIDLAEKLIARYPASSSVEDLLDEKSRPEERALALELIFKMALSGLATLLSEPVIAKKDVSRKPVAIALARKDAQHGVPSTANLRHENIGIDPLAQIVLPLLDGSHDTAAVTEVVVAAVRAGKISFARDGEPVLDIAAQERLASEQVRTLIPNLAKLGLIEG